MSQFSIRSHSAQHESRVIVFRLRPRYTKTMQCLSPHLRTCLHNVINACQKVLNLCHISTSPSLPQHPAKVLPPPATLEIRSLIEPRPFCRQNKPKQNNGNSHDKNSHWAKTGFPPLYFARTCFFFCHQTKGGHEQLLRGGKKSD